MATYSSKPVTVEDSAGNLFGRISDLSAFQKRMDSLPAEIRAKAGDVKFTEDSIFINGGPVGEMRLDVTRRDAPVLMKLEGANTPVPMSLSIQLEPVDDSHTQVKAVMEVDIPPMLKPLVGGKMQEAADRFGQLLGDLFNSTAI